MSLSHGFVPAVLHKCITCDGFCMGTGCKILIWIPKPFFLKKNIYSFALQNVLLASNGAGREDARPVHNLLLLSQPPVAVTASWQEVAVLLSAGCVAPMSTS